MHWAIQGERTVRERLERAPHVVYETIQLRLRVKFRATAQREAVEALVVTKIREPRFRSGAAPTILRAAERCIDWRCHARGLRVVMLRQSLAKEGDIPHCDSRRRSQALLTMFAWYAIALPASSERHTGTATSTSVE